MRKIAFMSHRDAEMYQLIQEINKTTMENELSESIKSKISKEAKTIAANKFDEIREATPSIMPEYLGYYRDGMATGYIAAAIKILSNPGEWNLAGVDWIPVESGLPPKFKSVLGLSKFGKIAITCVDSSGEIDQFELEVDYNDYWTHWISIPPKPNEPASPSTDRPDQYKKLLRIAGVPELLIENPGLIEGGNLADADKEWAEKKIREYEAKIGH